MTSHGKSEQGESKMNPAHSPDRRLFKALCGRYVPSWVFQPPMEAACQQCRDKWTTLHPMSMEPPHASR